MRGSIRNVIVTDSADSVALATDDSIKRKSGRLTDQNAASASSRSNSGTSSQVEIAFIAACRSSYLFILLRQRLVQFALIEVLFFRIKRPRINDSDLFPIRPIHTEHANPALRPAQVEKTRLDRKPGRIRQQLPRKRVFKRLLDIPWRQRTIPLSRRVAPIKLHFRVEL